MVGVWEGEEITSCSIINAKVIILISPQKQTYITGILLLKAPTDLQAYHRHHHLSVFSVSYVLCFFYVVLTDEPQLHLLQSGSKSLSGLQEDGSDLST